MDRELTFDFGAGTDIAGADARTSRMGRSLIMGTDRVLVVGGGIAGLATAAALQRRAVRVTVFERRSELDDAGLGLTLPGNAIAGLRLLGLGEAVDRLGMPVRRREYRNHKGRLLFSVDETAFWGPSAQPRCVTRRELHTALRRLITPGTLRTGDTVQGTTITPDDVRIMLTTGAGERGGVLIGADGVHSTVRDRVTGGLSARSAMLSPASWRFVASNPGIDCWTAWSGRSGTAVLIPLSGERVYGWLSADAETLEFDRAADAFTRFPSVVRESLAAATTEPHPPFWSPLEEVKPAVWTSGRAILAGDAAHAGSPVWAQGAAMAVEDALAIADVLVDRMRWPRAGQEFAGRRRARVGHVQRMTDRFTRVARLPPWLRDLAAPLIGPVSYRATYGILREPVRHTGV